MVTGENWISNQLFLIDLFMWWAYAVTNIKTTAAYLNRQFIWYDAYLFVSFNGCNYLIKSPDAIVAMLF
jgi:hypothetical protein